jgi:hypothetical protein
MASPRTVVAAAALTIVAAGCSGPAAEPDSAAPASRDVRLLEPAAPDAPAVSALEAGRRPNPRLTIRRPTRGGVPAPDPTVTQPAPLPVAATAGPAIEPTLAPGSAESAASEPTRASVSTEALGSGEEPVVLVGRGVEPVYGGLGPAIGHSSHGGRRDPVVIIRGGRGGVDDDCDVHRPGARRLPLAINQVAPPRLLGGGIR